MGLPTDIAYTFAGALASPVLAWNLWRTGKHKTDWRARRGWTAPLPDSPLPTILIHGVSVGEINATRLLVAQLLAPDPATGLPRVRIVVSATTDTGVARAKQIFAPPVTVVRYPLDFSPFVRRFLDAIKPDLVALVENEAWPNFTQICAQRSIPVAIINGRLSQRSFRRFAPVAPLLRPMYRRLSAVAAQTQEYADRFIAWGVDPTRVRVLDTMKWDTAQTDDPEKMPGVNELALALGIDRARPLIVAGSTGPGEEKLLIDTCPPEAQLLLVPRKNERFDEVARHAPNIIRRTQHADGTTRPVDGARLFLLDTIGELKKAYALASIAIVGRSFLGLYGSDLMEPAALGKPVIIGPFHADFADTVKTLQQADAIIVTPNPADAARQLLAKPARAAQLGKRGRDIILSRKGATARHASMLMALLASQGKQLESSPSITR